MRRRNRAKKLNLHFLWMTYACWNILHPSYFRVPAKSSGRVHGPKEISSSAHTTRVTFRNNSDWISTPAPRPHSSNIFFSYTLVRSHLEVTRTPKSTSYFGVRLWIPHMSTVGLRKTFQYWGFRSFCFVASADIGCRRTLADDMDDTSF